MISFENPPVINHNSIYISFYLHRITWFDITEQSMNSLKQIISEINQIESLLLIDSSNLNSSILEIIKESSYKSFEFIGDENIEQELVKRYKDVLKFGNLEMYLYASIILGTIIEQILRSYYNNINTKFINNIRRACETDNLISNADKTVLEKLDHIRNYIHVNLLVESSDIISKTNYESYLDTLNDFIRKFKGYFLSR